MQADVRRRSAQPDARGDGDSNAARLARVSAPVLLAELVDLAQVVVISSPRSSTPGGPESRPELGGGPVTRPACSSAPAVPKSTARTDGSAASACNRRRPGETSRVNCPSSSGNGKQYHLWPAGDGVDAWDVDRLVELSRELPVEAGCRSARSSDARYGHRFAASRSPRVRWPSTSSSCKPSIRVLRSFSERTVTSPATGFIESCDALGADGSVRPSSPLSRSTARPEPPSTGSP